MESEAFVYTSKAQILTFAKAVKRLPQHKATQLRLLPGFADATFKLISEGWVESQYAMRTLERQPDGKITQKFLPFLSAVSRTESAAVYRELFDCIRLVEEILVVSMHAYNLHVIVCLSSSNDKLFYILGVSCHNVATISHFHHLL